MIWHRALWRKSWLETRVRFFAAAALMLVVVGWEILDSQHAMSRFDRIPRITFPQYVAYIFEGRLQQVWVASVLLLGLGGVVREIALGTSQFTLALPFHRRDWIKVRAALGLFEAAVLALIPALVIPFASRFIGYTYPAWEALKFTGLLFAGGSIFLFLSLFWSSLVAGEFSAIALSAVSAFLIFVAQDYLYRWIPSFNVPYFNMSGFLGGHDFVNRATGFLNGWPWAGIIKSLCIGAMLFCVSVAAVERRDF